MKRLEQVIPDLVGDGHDVEPLLRAEEVAAVLRVPVRAVYNLVGLPRIRLGQRRLRWRPADVRAFIDQRAID